MLTRLLWLTSHILICAIVFFPSVNSATSAENLFSAIKSGDIGLVQDSIRNGANVNASDPKGITPLMWAVFSGAAMGQDWNTCS